LPDKDRTDKPEKGEFVTETSSETMKIIEDSLRKAALLYILPAVFLMVIGFVLWWVVESPWWLYVPMFAGGLFLIFFGILILSLLVSIPKLEIFEGGIVIKPPKGRTVFHPWKDFKGFRWGKLQDFKVIELHLKKGDGKPINIHEKVERYDEVKKLAKDNLVYLK
jgi:hypothetical protein